MGARAKYERSVREYNQHNVTPTTSSTGFVVQGGVEGGAANGSDAARHCCDRTLLWHHRQSDIQRQPARSVAAPMYAALWSTHSTHIGASLPSRAQAPRVSPPLHEYTCVNNMQHLFRHDRNSVVREERKSWNHCFVSTECVRIASDTGAHLHIFLQ